MKVLILRSIHALISLYFIACLAYVYISAFTTNYSVLLMVAIVSLAVEGFIVFVINNGDCPLNYIQKKIGDNKPFFEIFFPAHIAKRAIPLFAVITWIGVAALLISLGLNKIS